MNINSSPPHRSAKRRPLFLTDGGLETSLIYQEGWDLPEFAAFVLLSSSSGRAALRRYYQKYLALAERYKTGFVLATPTWRASKHWGEILGYNAGELDAINQNAVSFMRELAADCSRRLQSMLLVSGQVGPSDDGYSPTRFLSAAAAESYHVDQISSFASAQVDQIDALTITSVAEAIGIVTAASQFDLPVVISFTVDTNGCLPSGESLGDAIVSVDRATRNAAAHYMVNCAHPAHFKDALAPTSAGCGWQQRIGGLRANASRLSHDELDAAVSLDEGDPDEFAALQHQPYANHPGLWVLGGCCGTDHRHVEALAKVCTGIG